MANTFDLEYLVDNGTLRNWPTAVEPACQMVRWTDDSSYSVRDSAGGYLGYGDTKAEALDAARCLLTDRRRKRDGVVPAKVC